MSVTVKIAQFLLLSIHVFLLSGCTETPLGRSQLALLPEDYLAEMGRDAFTRMKASGSLVSKGQANQRVQCIADRIVTAASHYSATAPATDVWEVAVFDDPGPNAFAMPGAKIGVHTGMLALAKTDGQLAAVLGHEVGHVLARHGNERMTQELGINIILLLIGFLVEVDSALVFQALGVGAQLGVALPFSRAHETEADLIGLELMAGAGFDPAESVELWRSMAARSGQQPLEFLSTHPRHDTRIADLQAYVSQNLKLRQKADAIGCS